MTPYQLREINKNLEYYGPTFETRKAMEEASEYIQAINKAYCDGASAIDNLVGEIADVLITMEYIKTVYSITNDEIFQQIEKKIERQTKRREKDMNNAPFI